MPAGLPYRAQPGSPCCFHEQSVHSRSPAGAQCVLLRTRWHAYLLCQALEGALCAGLDGLLGVAKRRALGVGIEGVQGASRGVGVGLIRSIWQTASWR